MNKIIAIAAAAALGLASCQPTGKDGVELATPTTQNTPNTQTAKTLPEWAKTANIYEVNVRQYTPEGTLQAFKSHLPRLAEMNVDILWFMPIQPIGKENRKGELGSYYSISDYTAVNPNFGSVEDFQAIVEEAHQLGMHVVLDWVANHTSFDHVWVSEHPEFYTTDSLGNFPIVAIDNDGNPTDWTDVADLNYDAPGMRDAMYNAMNWWMINTGIDGFRCDVAGFVPYDFWSSTITSLREEHGDVFMLAEWEDPELIHAGFNAVYGWEFHHIMNEVAQGHKTWEDVTAYLSKCDTVWPEGTMKMYFTTNHDENSWNGTVQERMGDKGYAMYVLAFMMDRSFPLVYSGQEAGLNHRYPFFSKDTVGVEYSGEHPEANFFRTLFDLKNHLPALSNAGFGTPATYTVDGPQLTITKTSDDDSITAIINLETATVQSAVEGADLAIDVPYAQIWVNSAK